MPHSHATLLIHAIFSTKERKPFLDRDLSARLFPYMQQAARKYGSEVHIIDGASDHVHLLVSVPPERSIAEIMRIVKCNSTRWIRQEFADHRDFGWQTGYAAFSVSHSKRKTVYEYIARQQEHHRNCSFQEEFVTFLRKHQVDYDERYLWA
jgi:REP element-mobilizing transposase RayT